MRYLLFTACFLFFACNNNNDTAVDGEKPTKEDVTIAMKAAYESPANALDHYAIDIHSIKIGASDKATKWEVLDGIPNEATVTRVNVEYALTGFIEKEKKGTLSFYKNDFGEWKFKEAATD